MLSGALVTLRAATRADVGPLAEIRREPEVHRWWGGGDDPVGAVESDLDDHDANGLVIEHDGDVVGWIQWHEEDDPDYRHASMDVYVSSAWHGRGVGTDAVRTLAAHLIDDRGHHRLTIDPAADNAAAIRAYEKVGFRTVGVMRQYERGPDGVWHDNLLMDLLADELVRDPLTR
jgi:aminoglycoside 6'-N-acetyltransferase